MKGITAFWFIKKAFNSDHRKNVISRDTYLLIISSKFLLGIKYSQAQKPIRIS